MRGSYYRSLLIILVIVAAALWLDFPEQRAIQLPGINQEISTRLGLDLVGGTQTLLEADLPEGTPVDPESMRTARIIVENRVNGLGVSEAVVQLAGDRRILVELPGIEDPGEAVETIKGTALLEFADFSGIDSFQVRDLIGARIETDFATASAELATEAAPDSAGLAETRFHTVMTGADLRSVAVTTDPVLGEPAVSFELTDHGRQVFAEYTANHVGDILAIVLDKQVISAPEIQQPIPDGRGVIQGNFTFEEANNLAIQLRYGALPIPLKVVESRTVGPTLGQDSLQKSLVAGAIGLAIVMSFMMLYYRLPGLVANLSLMIYALIAFALFRTIPVTLTLAGIAGLMLSTGSALDANILIFERLKEELRGGRGLRPALDLGWRRAWPSIRDSNIATLITCAILYWFGLAFGATIVKGFALTLFIGVIVSLFTAILITRTLLLAALDLLKPANLERWFGL